MHFRHAQWQAPLLVLALVIGSLPAVEAAAREPQLLKVQLHKQQQQPSTDRSHRLVHQQTRARRRALEEGKSTVDGDFGLGALALSDEMKGFLKTYGFRFPVGCQTKETGLFITQKENGIMGLGRHDRTVLSYMLKAGRVTHNVFTLCFASDGGELVFGGVDYSHHTSTVDYTPLLDTKSTYYPVHVKDILMNGVSLGIDVDTINSGRGVLVDSGTTDTFFDGRGNRNFMKAFRNAAGGREYSDERMQVSNEDLAVLPIISVVLSGMKGDGTDDVQLDVPASKYLTLSEDGKSYTGNFHFSERSGGVLGSSIMVGLDVIFDGENNRIGFAESSCGRSDTNAHTANSTDRPISITASPIAPDQPANASDSSNNNSAADTNTTAAALSNTVDNADVSVGDIDTAATALTDTLSNAGIATSPFADATTGQASPKATVFIAGVITISLVGVGLGVMVWTKWHMRSWSRIPKRAHFDIADIDSMPLSSLPGRPLSPRSQSDSIAWSPKFTIGSSGEEDMDELCGEEKNEEEDAGV
uniref:Peptidase A1 domain-containing protein n=1 Tax=Hyaloperonospora arabidopsidis (strain Emoy2) TaxID=559515 RepID=M4C083_HYAAE